MKLSTLILIEKLLHKNKEALSRELHDLEHNRASENDIMNTADELNSAIEAYDDFVEASYHTTGGVN